MTGFSTEESPEYWADDEEADPNPRYLYRGTAQSWNTDSYYVASSAPVYSFSVVAQTWDEAMELATAMLPRAGDRRYYRFWLKEALDMRDPATKKSFEKEQ